MTKEELLKNPFNYPVRSGKELRKSGVPLKPKDKIVIINGYVTHIKGVVHTITDRDTVRKQAPNAEYKFMRYLEGTFFAPRLEGTGAPLMLWMIEDDWLFYQLPNQRKIGVFRS